MPENSGTERIERRHIGVVVVDHGSRREESNRMLLQLVELFREATEYAIVEPAHMELAEPTVATAFDRCVERGARLIVVYPYFLLPGRHWQSDIPALAGEAARRHPGVRYLVTAPLGLHPLMARIMDDRIQHCLAHALEGGEDCSLCAGSERCRLRTEGAAPDAEPSSD